MNSSKTRALSCLGAFAVLAACSAGACTKSDPAADDAGGTSAGGTANAGRGGRSPGGGAGGIGVAGAEAGAAESAGEGGVAGDSTGGTGGTGAEETAGAGAGAVGGACGADLQNDRNNCGRCGKVCESCEGGTCTPRVVLYPNPTVNANTSIGFNRRTVLVGSYVYAWEKVSDATQTLDLRYRVLRASTTPTNPPSSGSIVQDIPDDASFDYFVEAVSYDATYSYQCTTAGGTRVLLSASAATPTQIFKSPVAGQDCSAIAVSDTAVFMFSHDTTGGLDTLYTLPLASASATAVPTLVPNIGTRLTPVASLTVVGANIFWLENDLSQNAAPPNLVMAPTAGLAQGAVPTKIDSDLGNNSASIASDGSYLYWTDTHGVVGELRRTKLPYVANATPEVLLTDLDTVNPGLVMDANYVYLMEGNGDRNVWRVRKNGSAADVLGVAFVQDATGGGQHQGLQMTGVDANYVYFLLNDGLIARLPNVP